MCGKLSSVYLPSLFASQAELKESLSKRVTAISTLNFNDTKTTLTVPNFCLFSLERLSAEPSVGLKELGPFSVIPTQKRKEK